MLHAIVHSDGEKLHFVGALNGYNLQTLARFARHVVGQRGEARVTLRVERADLPVWDRHAVRWLWQMGSAGVVVDFEAEAEPSLVEKGRGIGRHGEGLEAAV